MNAEGGADRMPSPGTETADAVDREGFAAPLSRPRGAEKSPSSFRIIGLGLALVLTIAALLLVRNLLSQGVTGKTAAELPIGAKVPAFSLIRQDGLAVSRDDLRGQVWVADFIFTRCGGPCPTLSARMRALQYALADRSSHVKLVSFSLDPTYDTPPVLRRYARRFHADPAVWWFLTHDDEKVMHTLIRQGFFQSVFPATDDKPITHSNYFVIVDRLGRIRSAHDGLDPQSEKLVLQDIDLLLAEFAPS